MMHSGQNIVHRERRYYLAGFMNACVMACLLPIMSLYTYRYLNASATQLSALLGGYALSSIVYAFVISRIVERVGQHKLWLLGISLTASVALLLLAYTQNYYLATLVMIILFAPFHASTSLFMGLAFRYFPSTQIIEVNARLMATVSAAWLVCPSVAFYTVEYVGFGTFFYVLGAGLPLLAGLFCYLPTATKAKPSELADTNEHERQIIGQTTSGKAWGKPAMGAWRYQYVWPSVLFFTLSSFAITLYQHLLPVYFVEQALPVSMVGPLFMCAALVEIALIVSCVSLLSRFSYSRLFMIASLSGCAFFVLLPLSQNVFYLFALQGLKAIMYGAMAGLGVNLLQGLLPQEPTFGVALYQNAFAMGMLLAGFATGGVVEYLPSHWFFSISAIVASLCFLILLFFKYAFTAGRQV